MPPRPRSPMPNFMRDALNERGLLDAYRARPPYQRNDYIGWVTRETGGDQAKAAESNAG
jgi:hypothetical protein